MQKFLKVTFTKNDLRELYVYVFMLKDFYIKNKRTIA